MGKFSPATFHVMRNYIRPFDNTGAVKTNKLAILPVINDFCSRDS
jgi:hypothetical protein